MAKIKGKILVDTDRCKGCGICTTTCPFSLLSLKNEVNSRGYHFPQSVDQDRCTGCANCAIVCPDCCITVYRVTADE